MPFIVALTGGVGSGKSTVARAFARLGVDIVDADVVARQVVEPSQPALREIVNKYGHSVLHADGTLNRAHLRKRIFRSPTDKQWLNNLLHPLIHQKTCDLLAKTQSSWCLWVVPLLIENNLHKQPNRVLVVDVDPTVQLVRTMMRDDISCEEANNIITAQTSRQKRLAMADDVIDNSGTPEAIMSLVSELHSRYCTLASTAA